MPRIGITMGDPAGIGPEVVLKAVAEEEIRRVCVPVIIGDAQLLAHTARTLDLQSGYDIIRSGEPIPEQLSEPFIFHLDNISGLHRARHRVRRGGKSGGWLHRSCGGVVCGGKHRRDRDCADQQARTCFSVVTVFPVTRSFSPIYRRRGICDGVCCCKPAHRFAVDARPACRSDPNG